MAEMARQEPPRARVKRRRREVQQCLADFGLGRGPFRLRQAPHPRAAGQPPEHRLRAALAALGPVFNAFGAYLASRGDLLPDGYAAALASQSSVMEPAPAAVVREQIARELGRLPATVYAFFEDQPCAVGLLYQSHRARLADGRPVTVKVVHPDREEAVAADLAALSVLSDMLAGNEEPGLPLDSALADFRGLVRQEIEFAQESRVRETVAQDADEVEMLCVPRVHQEFSTARLLTQERLSGRTLAEIAAPLASGADGLDRRNLASRLYMVWLRLALFGRFFPAEVRSEDVLVLPDGRLAFTGAFVAMPSSSQKALWEYLLAVATGDSDGACMYLFRLMEQGRRPVHEDELRHLFRQAVPGREGASDSGSLSDLLLLHWRLALAQECRPPLYLTRFFRALFLLQAAAARLAPHCDALRDGLEDLRVAIAFNQFRHLLSLGHLQHSLEKFAPVLLELPRKLDEVLTLAAEGGARLDLHVRETAEQRSRKNATAATTALLLVLAAGALLAHHLAQQGVLGDWGTKAGAVLVVLVGGWLLGRLNGDR